MIALQAFIFGRTVPIVYALLSSKTEIIYIKLFEILKFVVLK
jgi:hypothetical protein